MTKSIVMATNLKVWSMSKGVGAPSFYKTIEQYQKKGLKIYFFTTEKGLDFSEFKNIDIINVPKLKALNIPVFYSFQRLLNYLLNQLLFLYVYVKTSPKNIDVYYGYEIEFIPALKLLSKIKSKPLISRFQGTILWPLMKKVGWRLRYFPHYFSIKIPAAVTIMTDDGTKGDKVAKTINNKSKKFLFLKNGVDFKADLSEVTESAKMLFSGFSDFDFNFISVSRLESWKRLDRSIEIFESFLKRNPNSRYLILGDGNKKAEYEELVKAKSLDGKVTFTGGVSKADIYFLMKGSDIFLSNYELSNVGNPLWEAMYNGCLVATLSNGDTGKVIIDGVNGLISQEQNYLENAKKLCCLNLSEIKGMTDEAYKTLNESVSTWDERMEKEYKVVSGCL
ncbi:MULTISPECIES: glycosyltransferase family 4 protein [unclassified Pseudoalteromonas]|uniref:glycosyltransferase family 4 protein n=1 Tax=unclassified Pseudoalteromonas TaxID=194690 RepID=UPI0025B3A9E6|nr:MULTISPECIES: glycosyltransferase family 4 protein [unclassified Pseudoalteromonas]MDN3408129.1 glycosyltransferase family 4 protein [Pseudoalteromonas sp. APC 3894]MDN3415769.1 glycosyltransferase family 4 protein [Pseudoalteromonas sp. APC 3227]MDN3419467.1 glycosyltransferase family 4 protein [Pseudoalteromonas sp. APC 3895]MDN3422836.1 glycosyltransferase family 4 protein [Pseudoalteromonas sp. APC 3896]